MPRDGAGRCRSNAGVWQEPWAEEFYRDLFLSRWLASRGPRVRRWLARYNYALQVRIACRDMARRQSIESSQKRAAEH